MFHHAKKTTTTIKQVNFKLLADESEYIWSEFWVTDDNNRSEIAAKHDIFRGTANYVTSENTFSLSWWVVFQKKSFHVWCKTKHTFSSDYLTWEILPNDIDILQCQIQTLR